MTRAVGSLITGDANTALRYHPVALLLLVEVTVIGLYYARTRSRPPTRLISWLAGANAMALAGVWLVRWRFDLLTFVVN